jgi:hypothetical protein
LHSEVERVATNLGMPTRSEIDTMGKRLHEVRREARQHAELLPGLADEVVALRAEVARLQQRALDSGATTRRSAGGKASGKPARKRAAKTANKPRTKTASKRSPSSRKEKA